jgi:hypothetical protein
MASESMILSSGFYFHVDFDQKLLSPTIQNDRPMFPFVDNFFQVTIYLLENKQIKMKYEHDFSYMLYCIKKC